MKRNTSNEKSTELITLRELSNKDLRERYLQTRKAIEEHPFEFDLAKSEDIPEEFEILIRKEELYTNELKKRELLEWVLTSIR